MQVGERAREIERYMERELARKDKVGKEAKSKGRS